MRAALSYLVLVSCSAVRLAPTDPEADVTRSSGAPAVESREYKVLLRPDLFQGDPADALTELWAEIESYARYELDRDTDGDLGRLDVRRTVRFLDVPGTCDLEARGWVLRERDEGGERELTLKYRSVDRFLAGQARADSDRDGADTKFEEDVSPGFVSRYSRSTTIPLEDDDVLETLDRPYDWFEGLEDTLDLPRSSPLAEVGAAEERRYGPAVVDLGSLDAELTVTLWESAGAVVLAEASFRYEEEREDYPGDVVERGIALFGFLDGLDAWRDPESLTKTSWIYGLSPDFCD